jgi:hypothetical protein
VTQYHSKAHEADAFPAATYVMVKGNSPHPPSASSQTAQSPDVRLPRSSSPSVPKLKLIPVTFASLQAPTSTSKGFRSAPSRSLLPPPGGVGSSSVSFSRSSSAYGCLRQLINPVPKSVSDCWLLKRLVSSLPGNKATAKIPKEVVRASCSIARTGRWEEPIQLALAVLCSMPFETWIAARSATVGFDGVEELHGALLALEKDSR